MVNVPPYPPSLPLNHPLPPSPPLASIFSVAENVTDEVAGTLSFQISQKIEQDMQYPGQIKITVIREMRAINYAK